MRRIHATILILAALLPMGLNAQLSVPYAEDFNTMTNISSLTGQGYSYYGCTLSLYTSSNYSCDGTKNLRFSGGGATKNRVLVFPAFSQDISNLALVFNTRPEGTSASAGVLDVGYVTDTADTASFVALQTYSYSTFPNGCLLKECRFASAPTGARIALRNRPKGSAYYWFVDDIEVFDTLNLCHWPTSVGMTAIGTTSATLTAADSTESTNDFRLTLDGNDMGIFFNQTTVSGLAPGSSHTAIVRSICSSNDSSDRTLTYNFTTRCGYTETAPFFDDMESHAAGDAPECYTTIVGRAYGTVFYPRVLRNAANARDTGYLRLQGLCNVIALPTVNLSADNMHVSFYMRYLDTTSGTLRAGVLTTLGDTSTFVPLFTVPNHSTQYTQFEFWTDEISADTAYVTFFWDSYSTKAAAFIDDITVEASVGCRRPNTTYIDSIDSTSVSLHWNNISVASFFQVGYNTVNDTATATVVDNIMGNSYTVSGLTPSTDYWFWVRTICDDTTGWQPVGNIRTHCLSGLLPPVNITFSAMPTGLAPSCWFPMQTMNYIAVQDEQYFGFGPVLQFSPGYGSSTIIAMPHIHLPANDMRVTVTAAIDALDTATLDLGYVTDLTSQSSFVPMVSVTSTTLDDYTFDTDTIADDTIWLAFRSSALNSQICFAYISAINVTAIPGCNKPAGVAIHSVTDAEATVRWRSTDATDYEVAIATVDDIDSSMSYTTADTAITLSGLLPSTQYFVWVRANCGGDYSEWTSSRHFTSMCDNGFCTINIHLVDNDYGGQLFNYAYAGIIAIVNGIPVALAGGPGTPDAVVDIDLPVCSTDSVAFIWIDTNLYEGGILSSLSYSISVGDGTILAAGTGANMYNRAVVFTTNAPCPPCPTPTAVDITASTSGSLTLAWTPAPESTAWLVSIDGAILDTIYDTTYTFTGLAAGTAYDLGVATLCDNAPSQFVTLQGVTTCAGTGCEVQVDMSSLHEYNVVWGSGNAVEIYAGNSLRGSASVPNGVDAATVYIPVCDGDSLTLYWHAGTNVYGSYCAFTAIAPGNDTLYSGVGSGISAALATTVAHCTGCQRPDSITVSYIGNTSATFQWPSTGAASYRLIVGDTVITTSATTATVTGLTPSTAYSYLLQACCTDGNSLATAGTFATACGPYPLPYFEDFDATPRDQLPLCWTAHSQYPDYMGVMTPSVYRGSSRAYSGFNSLELASNGHLRPMAVSIPLTGAPANKLHISFWLNGATHTGFEAGLMTDPTDTTTFIPLFVRSQAVLNYARYQFTTDSATFTDSVYYFALRYTSSLVMYNDIFLDDLSIRRIPVCSEEFTDITLLGVDESSVAVGWNAGPGDNVDAHYTVMLFNSNGDFVDSISTYNDSLTIGDLPSGATYRLCVQLICGGSESAVSDTVTFTTSDSAPCGLPEVDSVVAGEDFIAVSFHSPGDSTELQITSPDGIVQSIVTAASPVTFDSLLHSTSYTLRLRSHCGGGNMSEWVTLPVSTETVVCGVPSGLTVGGITFSSATLSWTAGADETVWNLRIFNTVYDQTYTCNSTSRTVDGLTAGVGYNVLVQALCGQHSNIPGDWSDTLTFSTEVCEPVNNVHVDNITATSATVSWTAGSNGNGSWLVEYGHTGFSRGEGLSAYVTDTTYTINNLEPYMSYDVYVASVCIDNITSVYSNVVTFQTSEEGIDAAGESPLLLYPNPADKVVTVVVERPSRLTVIDLSGRAVLETSIEQHSTLLDLGTLPAGTYFVRTTDNLGTAVRKLIVK